jgi:ubiquinone/menaquinone biosynthesis C-methylase UbiE
MVGDELRQGGSIAELTAGMRAGYDAAAEAWADGPGQMYTQLARVLVASAPMPLAGRRVLDLGAGAGVAGQAALAAGARQVVGVDLSLGMLRRGGAAGRPVAADAVALPFRDGSFDLVVAAFCLNHLGNLAAGLAEARRVGAAIAASMFAPGWTHPAKDASNYGRS